MKYLIYLFLLSLIGAPEAAGQSASQFMFVSSGTAENKTGIFVFGLNSKNQIEGPLHEVQEISTSSYLNLHPEKPYLYSVGDNTLTAFGIDRGNGSLTWINSQSTVGKGPCYVSVDNTGSWAFVANYSGGNVVVFPLGKGGNVGKAKQIITHKGSSVNPDRQKAPHPHMITVSPDNRYVLVPDLGADKIFIYRFDEKSGRLEANDTPYAAAHPGAGPRHLEFHPHQNFCYVINELNATVTSYKWDPAAGVLTELQTVPTLPAEFKEFNKSADIHLTKHGKYLYATNRGHNSLALFEVQADGSLAAAGRYSSGGDFPRNFYMLSDTALITANRKSGNVVLFDIEPETGKLVANKTLTGLPGAQCIKVWPLSR